MSDVEQARIFIRRQAADWRQRAEELRTVGEHTNNPAARQTLLDLAHDWDEMAGRAEARLKG
jgi:hypothetical protein